MADVFAFYDCSEGAPPGQAAMVTLWARGWANRGWSPRLITARHARRSKFYKKSPPGVLPWLALHAVGGGWLSSLKLMNFDFPAPAKLKPKAIRYPHGLFQASRLALEKIFLGKGWYNESDLGSFYGDVYWLKSPLVYFPDPNLALDCGRPL